MARVLSTALAIGGLVVLQRAQVAWLRWTAATALVLSLPFILWCSVALKRLVAGTLLYRQDDR